MSRFQRTGAVAALLVPAVLALAACAPEASRPAAAPEASSPARISGVAWAYPVAPAAPDPAPVWDDKTRLSLRGSSETYTMAALKDLFSAPDWAPSAHPPMPPVVAHGRKPDVRACGYCHLPTGDGRPENASLAGLPRAYFIEQMRAFRSGERRSSVEGRGPTATMEAIGKAMTDAEIEAAADYFAALPRRGFTQVVETDTVPRTLTTGWIYSRDPAGGEEPLGRRIIEMPEDFARFEMRDANMRYIAYAPKGSLERGAELARTWGQGTQACGSCHGPAYEGMDAIPALAGRSPTMIARQLNDFRTGARKTPAGEIMRTIAASMSDEDIIALSAYLASRQP